MRDSETAQRKVSFYMLFSGFDPVSIKFLLWIVIVTKAGTAGHFRLIQWPSFVCLFSLVSLFIFYFCNDFAFELDSSWNWILIPPQSLVFFILYFPTIYMKIFQIKPVRKLGTLTTQLHTADFICYRSSFQHFPFHF